MGATRVQRGVFRDLLMALEGAEWHVDCSDFDHRKTRRSAIP
jgi:hypothetical protein